MYEELVKRLRAQAEAERFYDGEEMLYEIAADAIEELSIMVGGLNNALVETVNKAKEET